MRSRFRSLTPTAKTRTLTALGVDLVEHAKAVIRAEAQLPVRPEGNRPFQGLSVSGLHVGFVEQLHLDFGLDHSNGISVRWPANASFTSSAYTRANGCFLAMTIIMVTWASLFNDATAWACDLRPSV